MPPARRVLQVAAPALVFAVDAAIRRWPTMPLAPLGLLDEAAHVATAWLAAEALRLPESAGARLGLLAGATGLDLDHVPQYLGCEVLARGHERPVTHSLGSVFVAVAAALVGPRRWRAPLACAGLGMATQLVRDLGTGPGIPLWWPVRASMVRAPYWVYALLILVAAVRASQRTSATPPIVVTPSAR